MPIRKIAIEEHIIVPTQTKHLVSSGALTKMKNALVDYRHQRVRTMYACNIDISILSAFSDGVQSLNSCQLSLEQAKLYNDELFEISKTNPRYRCFAALPMCDAQAAADELERCVTQMGFLGALVNGFDSSGGTDEYYDTPKYDVLWQKLVDLDVPMYLHPRLAHESTFFEDKNCAELRGSPWGFHSSTARLVLALIMNGVCDRFPKLKFIIGHNGEIVVYWAWRIDHRLKMEGSRTTDIIQPTLKRNFYVTISGWLYTPAFMHTLQVMGPDRVMYATDYPMEDAEAQSAWFEKLPISKHRKKMIAHKNAEKLFKLAPSAKGEERCRSFFHYTMLVVLIVAIIVACTKRT